MGTLELLANLGLPSAIVAMVLIAYLFRSEFSKLSKVAIIISIFLASVFGVVQLIMFTIGEDVQIVLAPEQIYAITPKGSPTDLRISALRGGKELQSKEILAPDARSYQTRLLSLALFEESNRFAVKYNGNQLGLLNFQMLRDKGWRPAYDPGANADGEPRFWYTYKIFPGQDPVALGDTENGRLTIKLHQITNKVEVSLNLEGHKKPIPERLYLANKAVGMQDFEGLPTYYVVVREADFGGDKPWAAFSVFTVQ